MNKYFYPIGFSFHDRESIENRIKSLSELNKFKVIFIDSPEADTNPDITYTNVMDKDKTIFIINGIDVVKLLVLKLGRIIEGNFIVLDSCYNLKQSHIMCFDGSYSNGFSKAIDIRLVNLMPLISEHSSRTKFYKNILNKQDENNIAILMSVISKKKKIHEKVFKKTLQEIIKNAKDEIKIKVAKTIWSSVERQIGTIIVKCVVNYLPYSELNSIKLVYKDRVIEVKTQHLIGDVKKYANTSGGIRTIRAFQDMMYYLTDKDTALLDNVGDPFTLNLMLDYWNPSPQIKKSILFINNKKPLPASVKSRKKIKRWENQKHIISSQVVLLRKESVNTIKIKHHPNSKLFTIGDSKLTLINPGVVGIKTLCSRMNIPYSDNLLLFGGVTKDNKVHLCKGDVISVINKSTKEVYYSQVK